MTSPDLREYISRQKERGVANIKSFEIENQKRYAMTAAAFILTVIGMSLSSRKIKGGMGVNIGIGLVLSFSYILFMTPSPATPPRWSQCGSPTSSTPSSPSSSITRSPTSNNFKTRQHKKLAPDKPISSQLVRREV